MAYIPAHDKNAEQCEAEIERLTKRNDNLLIAIMDPKNRERYLIRDRMSDERFHNTDYIRRLKSRLRSINKAAAPQVGSP